MTTRPSICLNMIVRNESHIIHELFDSVAPFISSWVIVDTGSDDGTPDLIRTHMASLDIPGALYERPWRDFGRNRSEALELAQGHGDYLWVMDADDILVGTPDFTDLTADVYQMHYGPSPSYWRRQVFRNGMPWRYVGVLHEYADCGQPYTEGRLGGEYHIESRRLGDRSQDPHKYLRDAELLLTEVQREPDNSRSVFYLAQSYFDYGDYANARQWYARRAEMGGWDEETYYAMARVADSMWNLGEPWPATLDAYLRAWEFRPQRAEPLHAIARRYRMDARYQLGYLFADRAAQIPLPDDDQLFVAADIYHWRALDEKAVCASWIGKQPESFALCRQLLARDDIPEEERPRLVANRDVAVPSMLELAVEYPGEIARTLAVGPRDAEVTVTLVAGTDRTATERTLNSFLNSCLDAATIGHFVIIDTGLSRADRETLRERYPFLEFSDAGHSGRLARICSEIGGRYWLHLGRGCLFFAADPLITRSTAVLAAEPAVYQVGVNLGDAAKLTGLCPPENSVRHSASTGRYVLSDTLATGPAMFDIDRLRRIGGLNDTEMNPVRGLTQRAAAAAMCTATLDEVLCIADT